MELAANFLWRQPVMQSEGAETRVGLALAGDDVFDVDQEGGQMFLGAKPPAQREGIAAGDAGGQFMHAFANGDAVPAELSFSVALAALPQRLDGARHEQTPVHPAQALGCLGQRGLDTFRQLNHLDLLQVVSCRDHSTKTWDTYFFPSPLPAPVRHTDARLRVYCPGRPRPPAGAVSSPPAQ